MKYASFERSRLLPRRFRVAHHPEALYLHTRRAMQVQVQAQNLAPRATPPAAFVNSAVTFPCL
jgi:hypothetical protein